MSRVYSGLSERQAQHYLKIRLDALRHEVNAGRLQRMGTKHRPRFEIGELERWRRSAAITSLRKK